jgi:hypothetical protein
VLAIDGHLRVVVSVGPDISIRKLVLAHPMPPDTLTVIHPAPDDSTSQESSKEAYSEGDLSAEAPADTEPFLLRKRTDEKVADYDKGLRLGRRISRTTTPRARLGSGLG